jgi:hypothetical protein
VATPTLVVTFDFSSGAVFGYPFIIGEGVLGFNTLADAAADTIDISTQVNKVSIRRGYNLLQEEFQAGIATIRVLDQNGDWNPTNPSSPYFGKLVPLRKVRISADGEFLFSGYTIAYNYFWDKEQNLGYVDIQLADAFRLLNMSNITTVTGATSGETTGNRVTDILDTIGFPNSMRSIETGSTTVQADPGTSRTSLQAIKNMEFSEQGAFFIEPSGNAEFLSRATIQAKSGVNPTFFSNDGTGIGYTNLRIVYGSEQLANEVVVSSVITSGTATAIDIATYVATAIDTAIVIAIAIVLLLLLLRLCLSLRLRLLLDLRIIPIVSITSTYTDTLH